MSKQIKISDEAYDELKKIKGNTSAEKILYLIGFKEGKLSVTRTVPTIDVTSNPQTTMTFMDTTNQNKCKEWCNQCRKGQHNLCVNKNNCDCEY